MKGKTRKLIAMIAGLAVILTIMLFATSVAFADEELPTSITTLYYPKQKSSLETNNYYSITSDISYDVDLSKSSIDDPSIVSFKESDGYVYLLLKKAGTTMIHLSATPVGSSESKIYDIRVKLEKYVNPVKTFKIGKKNYASKLKKFDFVMVDKNKVKGKLKVKAAKGWKIVRIERLTTGDQTVRIKNNKKVTLKRGKSIYVYCKNKKTGQLIQLILHNMEADD